MAAIIPPPGTDLPNIPLDPPVGTQPPKTGSAGYWYTGYSGNKKPGDYQAPQSPQQGFGFPQGSPGQQAAAGAYNRSEEWFQKALAELNQNYMSGPLANFAQGRFTNPQGIDPVLYEQMKRQASELFSGQRADRDQSLRAGANASGFDQSMGLLRELDRSAAENAAQVSDANLNIDVARAREMQGERQIMMQMIAALLGADVSQNQAAAGLMANKTEPVIPGVTPAPGDGQGGQTWKWLGADGRQAPGKFPRTQREWEEFQQERLMWEMLYGGGARF